MAAPAESSLDRQPPGTPQMSQLVHKEHGTWQFVNGMATGDWQLATTTATAIDNGHGSNHAPIIFVIRFDKNTLALDKKRFSEILSAESENFSAGPISCNSLIRRTMRD